MEKANFGSLLNQAKASNNTKVTQKVVPIKNYEKDEVQFSFYIEKELLKKLKLKALQEDKSLKSLINEAIESSLVEVL